MFIFFQSLLSCSPFLVSLEQELNTFCRNWIVEYNQITYHEKKLQVIGQLQSVTINYTVAINYSYKLLQNQEIIKKCVPQNAKISKLESISSKSSSQLRYAWEHLLWGTARCILFHYNTIRTDKSQQALVSVINRSQNILHDLIWTFNSHNLSCVQR